MSLFSPTGEKSPLKIWRWSSDVHVENGEKRAKVRDQVSLAARGAPPANRSRISCHPWERCRLWGLRPILGCSLRLRRYKLPGHLTTWPTPHWSGRALAPVSRGLSFRQCADGFTALQCFRDNGEKDPCPRSWVEEIHSTMGVSYTLRPTTAKRVEALTELLHILNTLEVDSFDRIPTGDESWFQYLYESSAMFAKSPHDVPQ
jgi:hypothetical protein